MTVNQVKPDTSVQDLERLHVLNRPPINRRLVNDLRFIRLIRPMVQDDRFRTDRPHHPGRQYRRQLRPTRMIHEPDNDKRTDLDLPHLLSQPHAPTMPEPPAPRPVRSKNWRKKFWKVLSVNLIR